MPLFFYLWDDETIRHVADNSITPEEFEAICDAARADDVQPNKIGGRWEIVGTLADGRTIKCVFEKIDDEVMIAPVNAFQIGDNE